MKPISPEELAKIGKRLYGGRYWITRMSEALGIPPSTVWRWAHGKMQIAPISITAIRGLDAQRKIAKAVGKSK